jgi:hypothetical protein
VENELFEVLKHIDLRCMEEGALQRFTYDTGNMAKPIEFSVNMAQCEFSSARIGVGIAQHSLYIVIPLRGDALQQGHNLE